MVAKHRSNIGASKAARTDKNGAKERAMVATQRSKGARTGFFFFFFPSSLFLFFLFLQESSVNLIYVHVVAIIYGNITFIVKEDKRKLE